MASLIFLVGGIIILGGKGSISSQSASASSTEISGIEVSPQSYDLGNVPINGGNITKDYEVKNTTDKTIKLKKVATSCMCTKAKVTAGGKESKLFGMEGMGDLNPPVNIEIASGEMIKVTAIFDPAAHGPQGVGPIDRSVILTFSDPVGIKELKFDGTVVK